MMAWMNKESLQKTLEARETWFYSRSRQKLWHKGEESGHIQHIERLYIDCDEDTIVAQVLPEGPACHTGNCTCFFRGIEGFTNQETKGTLSILHALSEEIKDRKKNPQPKSYTNYLLAEGSDKIDKKIGEEASEVIIADQHKDKKKSPPNPATSSTTSSSSGKTQASTSTTSWPKWKEETKSKETRKQ